ncbi:MAG: hypothetical protein COX70_05375 [Flavobacteriales bacterium CG_4_10_14_0_2_um_filter_32_8]|nr:MAG: hypothetical protein COX70_05375 [Flavobacteriales bacterium CG_4_10_14_0_2_um_filter_32_8]PJB14452.1 MAG: hypothetical protein CO118_08400 [Flavobacteriales bacterium CG_4_9_14_3_um_filter_32_8]
MKNLSYLCGALLIIGSASSLKAQLIDEKDVTVTMDLQPVLQLDMTTPDQIEFVFDEINEYYAGITKYGATVLRVSSTVSWDLYAVGRSTGTNGPEFWDQQIDYGNNNVNAIPDLPLSLLELHQNQPNNGDGAATGLFSDYNQAFSPATTPSAGNSLYVNAGTNTPPTTVDKYIGGHAGTSGIVGADFLPGGSYLTQTGLTSDYFYVIDYRILPSLPAIFPNAADADGATFEDIATVNGAGAYAEPGVYTMYVQYILLEDQ